jgi:hypothetical protein
MPKQKLSMRPAQYWANKNQWVSVFAEVAGRSYIVRETDKVVDGMDSPNENEGFYVAEAAMRCSELSRELMIAEKFHAVLDRLALAGHKMVIREAKNDGEIELLCRRDVVKALQGAEEVENTIVSHVISEPSARKFYRPGQALNVKETRYYLVTIGMPTDPKSRVVSSLHN